MGSCDGHLVYGGGDLDCAGGALSVDEAGWCGSLRDVSGGAHAADNVGCGARDVGGGFDGCVVVV